MYACNVCLALEQNYVSLYSVQYNVECKVLRALKVVRRPDCKINHLILLCLPYEQISLVYVKVTYQKLLCLIYDLTFCSTLWNSEKFFHMDYVSPKVFYELFCSVFENYSLMWISICKTWWNMLKYHHFYRKNETRMYTIYIWWNQYTINIQSHDRMFVASN